MKLGRRSSAAGKLRVRHRRARGPSPNDALVNAIDVEVYSEDFKLLRTLLVLSALVLGVYLAQAGALIEAVRFVRDAQSLVVADALLNSELRSVVNLSHESTEFGKFDEEPTISYDAKISPTRTRPRVLTVDAAAQAHAMLSEDEDVASVGVKLRSEYLNAEIEAQVSLAKPEQWPDSEAVLRRLSRRDFFADSGFSLYSTRDEDGLLARTVELCSHQYLAVDLITKACEKQCGQSKRKLLVGRQVWMVDNFRRRNESDGKLVPIFRGYVGSDITFLMFRHAVGGSVWKMDSKDCSENYPLKIVLVNSDSEYLKEIENVSFDPTIEQFKARLEGALLTIESKTRPIAGVDGIEFGVTKLLWLSTLALTVLSVLISTTLRKLDADSRQSLRVALLGLERERWLRRSIVDGPHLVLVELAIRALLILIPILAAPIAVLTVPLIVSYPNGAADVAAATWLSVVWLPSWLSGLDPKHLMYAPFAVAGLLLCIQAVHQASLCMLRKRVF